TLAWTSPMFLAVVAAVVLKENVTLRRWLVVLIGFAGVVLITNPASEEFSLAMLLPLAAAALISVRDLVTRRLDPGLHSLYVTWTTLVAVTIAGFLISFLDWKPVALTQIIWLAASAMFLSSAYFFQIRAVRLGELSFVAPFSYTGILAAVFYGFVVWSDLPGPTMILGILLVMSSGLYILSHQATSPAR
ncbi:MAG: DMT family transporter, partial [Rhodospirillaceae bacterium]|nr:DMT family transporter [Rhodospirillaceae bacterium]